MNFKSFSPAYFYAAQSICVLNILSDKKLEQN